MAGIMALTLRASLKPRLYRDIEIDGKATLHALAEAITSAFNFDFDHAFGFFSRLTGHVYDSPVRYELFAEAGADATSQSVKRTPVALAFPRVGSRMLFLFDYGHEWRFLVEVVGQRESANKGFFTRVVGTAGKAPRQYEVFDDEA